MLTEATPLHPLAAPAWIPAWCLTAARDGETQDSKSHFQYKAICECHARPPGRDEDISSGSFHGPGYIKLACVSMLCSAGYIALFPHPSSISNERGKHRFHLTPSLIFASPFLWGQRVSVLHNQQAFRVDRFQFVPGRVSVSQLGPRGIRHLPSQAEAGCLPLAKGCFQRYPGPPGPAPATEKRT